ncbi:MAG: class I SAM-dependent methyltransferase [Promethearchaeota archaeon]
MKFKDRLKIALQGELTEAELNLLPRGFQSVGDVIIIKLHRKLFSRKNLIGQKCLEIYPSARSVYLNTGKIIGTYRTPEGIQFLAGIDDPVVEHREHGVIYKFDITKLMFSKGNVNERKRIALLVQSGEIVVDMFAGIGYFSLPIAKLSKPKKVYSIEMNPTAYKFLLENIKINKLEGIIEPILGDSKNITVQLSRNGIKADRVIMGVFPAPKDFIPSALLLAKEDGTIYHYEGVVSKNGWHVLFEEFAKIAKEHSFECELKDKNFVKSYGPDLYHVVVDILVYKK